MKRNESHANERWAYILKAMPEFKFFCFPWHCLLVAHHLKKKKNYKFSHHRLFIIKATTTGSYYRLPVFFVIQKKKGMKTWIINYGSVVLLMWWLSSFFNRNWETPVYLKGLQHAEWENHESTQDTVSIKSKNQTREEKNR